MGDFLKQFRAEVERARTDLQNATEANANRLYQTILNKVSKRSVMAFEKQLGSKPGALRGALRRELIHTPQGFQINIYFDRRAMGPSRFIISGTRSIQPNNLIERSWMQSGMEEGE